MSTVPASPLIYAVVVPTHGRHEDLSRVLDCLATQVADVQHRDRFSVCLVFDGDEEGYERFSHSHDWPDLSVSCQLIQQGGPSAARNYGARVCGADVVAFLDSDIVPSSTYVGSLMDAFDSDSGMCVLRGPVVADPPRPSRWFRALVRGVFVANDGKEWFYSSANFAWRREAFLACGGFDPIISMPSCEDLDLCWRWRIRDHGEVAFCSGMAVVHPTTKMTAAAAFREFRRKQFDAILMLRFPQRYLRIYFYQWAQVVVLAGLLCFFVWLAFVDVVFPLGLLAAGIGLGLWKTRGTLDGLAFTRWERVSGVLMLPLLPLAYAVNFGLGVVRFVGRREVFFGRCGRWPQPGAPSPRGRARSIS